MFGFWGLKLSKPLLCAICSLFDVLAFIESVLATRDSSNELGIETIGARPARSDMGGATHGDCESRVLRVVASLGAEGIGETSANGRSNFGVSLNRRLRVLRRSWRASRADSTLMTCRGGVSSRPRSGPRAGVIRPYGVAAFTEGVVGIVEAKLAETSFGGIPENGFVLAKMRSELAFAV